MITQPSKNFWTNKPFKGLGSIVFIEDPALLSSVADVHVFIDLVHFGILRFIWSCSRRKILNLLWRGVLKHVRRFDLLLQILITHWLSVTWPRYRRKDLGVEADRNVARFKTPLQSKFKITIKMLVLGAMINIFHKADCHVETHYLYQTERFVRRSLSRLSLLLLLLDYLRETDTTVDTRGRHVMW